MSEREQTMKKLVAAILVVIGLLAILLYKRVDIVLGLYSAGIERAITNTKIAALEDGLHIALCGAGGPMPSVTRSGPCVAVVAGSKLFLVDTGANGVRNLGRMGYDPGAISGVFLTHFHSDHIDGLGEVATLRWAAGNHSAPLPVYGPEGVSVVVDGFNTAYSHDFIYRHDHHGDSVTPISGKGMQAISFAVADQNQSSIVYNEDGLKVEMFAVNHFPIDPAVAYLFSYKGRTALISGDTTKIASVEKFAIDVDLLVHEALAAHMLEAMNRGATAAGHEPRAKMFDDVLNYHATPVEVAEIARTANVGHLLYYHVVPPLDLPGSEAVWLQGVDKILNNYTLGRDGTSFSLPANSEEIIHTKMGL